MEPREKLFKAIVLSFLIIVLGFPGIINAAYASDGLYIATTADNVNLKMLRYRPSTETDFNSGNQPILLFPGIGANINEFLPHTPPGTTTYDDMELPLPLAEWATNDSYIEKDPMLYYNLAYYLWKKGYDVWLANNRGVGRGDFRSEKGNNLTTLDVWAILDTGPCIDKVVEVTGLKPIIGGHSTGALMCYIYLQGTYFDVDDMRATYNPKVEYSTALAKERNSSVKGYIAIDPAGKPPVPGVLLDLLKNDALWLILGLPIYLDMDTLSEQILKDLPSDLLISVVDIMYGSLSDLADNTDLPAYWDIFGAFEMFEVNNTHPYIEDYYARYALGGMCLRAFSQYVDWAYNGRPREHWKNGFWNSLRVKGPKPGAWNDNYYYYDDNMYKLTLPVISVFSQNSALVDTDTMVEFLMDGKTKHTYDEWYEAVNTGHIDVPVAYNAPTFTYVKIGSWLDKVSPVSVGSPEPVCYQACHEESLGCDTVLVCDTICE